MRKKKEEIMLKPRNKRIFIDENLDYVAVCDEDALEDEHSGFSVAFGATLNELEKTKQEYPELITDEIYNELHQLIREIQTAE